MAVGGVVFVLEVGNRDAGFEQVGPVVAVEALLAQAVVERFDEPVVPRRSWLDNPKTGYSRTPRFKPPKDV